MQITPNMTLADVEKQCSRLRDARDEVTSIVTELEAKVEELHADARRRITSAVARTTDRRSELVSMIDLNRGLFEKPRTQTFHGIRCGVAKGKGKIEFEDNDTIVANIEKKLPDLADQLIKTEKTVLKGGLKTLTVAQLKSLGCTVEETGDYVIVAFTDKGIEKQVKALLASAVKSSEVAEAACY